MRAKFGFTVHFMRTLFICAFFHSVIATPCRGEGFAFTPAEADRMQREQDAAAQRFLKNHAQRANADLVEMSRRRIEPTKAAQTEQAQAFEKLSAVATYDLLLVNRTRLLARIEALQKQIAGADVRVPANFKLRETLAALTKEFTEGYVGKRTAEYQKMAKENRDRQLPNDKSWLIDASARTEIALQTVTYNEKCVALITGVNAEDRARLYSRESAIALQAWNQLLKIAANQSRTEFAAPHADSLYHPNRRDIGLAHPSSMTDNGQDIAANLNWHRRIMATASSAEMALHLVRLNQRWGGQ